MYGRNRRGRGQKKLSERKSAKGYELKKINEKE